MNSGKKHHHQKRHQKVLIIVIALLAVVLAVPMLVLSPRDRGLLLSSARTFVHDGVDRQYLLSVPAATTDSTKLIIGLHGFGDSPKRFAYYTGLHNAANSDDIVVYPSALPPRTDQEKPGWNAGFCCGSGWVGEANDSDFIAELTRSLVDEYNLDPDTVFVAGFSNGAFMSQRLVIDHPDIFKGAAVVSGSIGTAEQSLQPKVPTPILLMHGEKDVIVPFSGGAGATDPDFVWRDFAAMEAIWTKNNQGTEPVKTITHPTNKHVWGDWRILNIWHKKPQASVEVMNFFSSISDQREQ